MADGDEMRDGVGVDHEQSGSEGEMADSDTPKRERAHSFTESPITLVRVFCRVTAETQRSLRIVAIGILADVLRIAPLK